MNQDPERLVRERVRAALGVSAATVEGTSAGAPTPVYANVRWVAPAHPCAPARDGEADLVVIDPARGTLLVIETKGGTVSLDGRGRWYAGHRHLEEPPFQQAMTGAHVLSRKIEEHPDWHGDSPIHAVAFPEADRASLRRGEHPTPDAPLELILDRSDFADLACTRDALSRISAYWSGSEARDRPLSERQLEVIDEVLAVLKTLGGMRRAAIVGGAGSGKTILAREKARQLAAEGYNTLLVCFNQPLARNVADDPELLSLESAGRLDVSTFHQLCLRLGDRDEEFVHANASSDRRGLARRCVAISTRPREIRTAPTTSLHAGGLQRAWAVMLHMAFAPGQRAEARLKEKDRLRRVGLALAEGPDITKR